MSTTEVDSNDAERNAGVARGVAVDARIRDELLATYAAYLAAFRASDIGAIATGSFNIRWPRSETARPPWSIHFPSNRLI